MDAGLKEYPGTLKKRLTAGYAKQVEDSPVFAAHARPKAGKRRNV